MCVVSTFMIVMRLVQLMQLMAGHLEKPILWHLAKCWRSLAQCQPEDRIVLWGGLLNGVETWQHALLEAERPCLWWGFLLSGASFDCVFGLRRLLVNCWSVSYVPYGLALTTAFCLEQWLRMVVLETSSHVPSPRDDQCSLVSNSGSCSHCEFSFSCDFAASDCSAFDSLEPLLWRQHCLVSGQ